MSLPSQRDIAFNEAKILARDNAKAALYESLVLQYTNPRGEWGYDNLRDLVM